MNLYESFRKKLNEDVQVFSNLNLDNMADELRTHFKGVTNKDYIKKSLDYHLKEKLISNEDYNILKKEYGITDSLTETNTKYDDYYEGNDYWELSDAFVNGDIDNEELMGSLKEMYSEDAAIKKYKEITGDNDFKKLNEITKGYTSDESDSFTQEEKEEYNLDDEGYDDSGEKWIHCEWCKDVVPVSDCKKELNLGWICDRCQKALYSRGEKPVYDEYATFDESDEDSDKKLEKLIVDIQPEIIFHWAEGDQRHVANLFGSAEEHEMDFNDFQKAVYSLDSENQEEPGYDKVKYTANIKCTSIYSDGSEEVEDSEYAGRVDCGDGYDYVTVKNNMKRFIETEPGYEGVKVVVNEPGE